MINKLFESKIIHSLIITACIAIVILYFLLPVVTQKNTIDIYSKNSQIMIEQIKLNREYYAKNIVSDIKKAAPNISFHYNHEGVDGVLPFPTTTIHDLSKIYSEHSNKQFILYSEYPFKPNINRVLSDKQQKILEFTKNNEDGIFVETDIIDGRKVLRVAVTDFMTDISCINCHNAHSDKTWDFDWKLGDRRGVIEVISPLDDAIDANNALRNNVIIVVLIFVLILFIYYSYVILRRESELIDKNKTLDSQIKEEIDKNEQNEKLVLLQNRNALLGEMLASIIHQLKQPLSVIKATSSSTLTHSYIEPITQEFLEQQLNGINKHVDQMSVTMDDFRDFFRPKELEVFDLNKSINNVLNLLGDVYSVQNVVITTNLQDNLFVKGYSNELNQVIINLLNNARDQIIQTNASFNEILINTYSDNEYNYISVEDFAGGIDENILGKIFEPYFTTKTKDNGTGIGLDICKTILTKVDASISVINNTTTINSINYVGAKFIIKYKKEINE